MSSTHPNADELDLARVGDDRLLPVTISPVARLLAGQMMVHLGVQNPLGQGLLQVVEQPVGSKAILGSAPAITGR